MFAIDSENNIVARAAMPANLERAQAFESEKELAKLAAEWPGCRLAEIWNSFAGVAPFSKLKPVKKFTDRKAAVARIWAGGSATVPRRCATGARRGDHQGQDEEVPDQSSAARAGEPQREGLGGAQQQESGGDRDDEARQGRYAGRDYGSHFLAGAHRARLREHPRQQGWREGRVVEERQRGTHLPHCEIARQFVSSNAASGSPGRRCCLSGAT